MITINYILCNLIGAAVFLQAAQVHDANVPRLPLRAWESDYARLGWTCIMPYNKNVGNEESDFANESTLIEYIHAQSETHQNGKWWYSIPP